MSNEQRTNRGKTRNEARTKQGFLMAEARGNHEELTNEQLVIRIKAGEDVAGNRQTGKQRPLWASPSIRFRG